jgi:hypothetical protein
MNLLIDPPAEMRCMVSYTSEGEENLLLGCNTNAHHTAWGKTDTNIRGEHLLGYLVSNNLFVLNQGSILPLVAKEQEKVLT